MTQRKIQIAELRVGMFLTGVDRSWLHTPFLRHNFKITDRSEIEALRKAGIMEVTIDPEQGIDVETTKDCTAEIEIPASPTAVCESEEGPSCPGTQQSPTAMLAGNFAQAKQRRVEWMGRLNTLFEGARRTGLVQVEVVHQLVNEMIGEILDQQAACFAVLRIQQPDPTLHEHGLTVCILSVILGQALNYPREVMQQIGVGALLHDIGLAQLPRNIIKRSKSMPAAHQALYLTHPTEGVATLEKSGSTDPAVMAIVREHHELSNSIGASGSMPGTTSELAKLVGTVDQYDELVTGQMGLPPMSSHQALTQLYQRHRASPELLTIVSHLVRAIGVYPLYSVVKLKSGELGVVSGITPGKAHLPLLYLCRDNEGRPCVPPVPLDLISEAKDGKSIERVCDAAQEGIDVEGVLRQVAA
jgi:hypothetical protein